MAQGAIASMPTNGTTALTAEELHEILECEKIVRFRDAVLSGMHPRIKVPPQMKSKLNATRHVSSPNSLPPRPNLSTSISPGTYTEDNHALYNNQSSNTQRITVGRSASLMPMMAKAAKSEINPILLEKSDDLIKAEIQLQRQRLERALREQVEQRRLSLKASLQTSESLPDFDISDVLSKALTIVHPSTAADVEHPVGDHTSASDSFDENTFYSSQHDTPEQISSSQERREPGETQAQGIPLAAENPPEPAFNRNHHEPRDVVMMGVSLSNNVDSGAQELVHQQSPLLQHPMHRASIYSNPTGLNIATTDTQPRNQTDGQYEEDIVHSLSSDVQQAPGITVSTQSDGMSGTSSDTPGHLTDLATMQTGALLKRKFGETASLKSSENAEPAIIRTRDDVPALAPQPARVSPLATARAPPVIDQSLITGEAPAPQIVALRKSSAVSSPESSPKGTKTSDKKKKKKKTRKSSGKQPASVDTPDSTYIKPEPRSTSPFAAVPLPRPLQRQRQTLQQGPELNYDEPRYEAPREEPREQVVPLRDKDHGPRPVYDRPEDERLYEPRDGEVSGYHRVKRPEKQYRRIVSHDDYRAPTSPGIHPLPYSSAEPRSIRAVSHAVADRRIRTPPRFYRDLPPRASVRPDADRERSRSPIMRERRSPVLMAPPPRLAPARILIDEYGRQYYAPVPVTSRQSVAPSIRPGDEDLIYERAPLRPVVRPVADLYDEEGLVYRRPSPPLPPPRRVITQPDPEMDYRSYRQREYSSRPVAIAPRADEYVRIREPVERRQMSNFEEVPREYVARVGSVRPEGPRYGLSREYVGRVQSVRPEPLPQDYAASVRPEPRRDIAAQSVREFSVRPHEPETVRREYMTAPDSGYAPVRSTARRVFDETEYIELAREVPQDSYADERRPEVVYR